MAEGADRESKTEEATEKKVQDALEKGNVPFTKEAAAFASLAAVLVVGGFVLREKVVTLVSALSRLMESPGNIDLRGGEDATVLFIIVAQLTGNFLGPVVGLLMLFGVIAAVVQSPMRILPDRIAPQASRISISAGWSRLFGMKGLVETLKAAAKLLAIGITLAIVLGSQRHEFLDMMFVDPSTLPDRLLSLIMRLAGSVTVAAALLVAGDFLWSRMEWMRELRMTKQEVKDEHKEAEGDPLMKGRLRSLALDRSRRRMMAAVPRATMVIANPTHYAIALRYVREEGGAPLVLAKGMDLVALKIREIAEEAGVPVIEDKALARSMFDAVEVDQMIPPAFYKAVAEIIHYLRSRGPGMSQTRGPR